MIRRLLSLCRRITSRLASPSFPITVILLLVNCYLLTKPDRNLALDTQNRIIEQQTQISLKRAPRSQAERSPVLVVPLADAERSPVLVVSLAEIDRSNDEAAEKDTRSAQQADNQNKKLNTVQKVNASKNLVTAKVGILKTIEPNKKGSISTSTLAEIRRTYVIPDIKYTTLAKCDLLIKNETKEFLKAKETLAATPKVPIYEEYYMEWTKNCDDFKKMRGYIEIPLTEEEETYPLAFSISMFKDAEQVERLLRAIYQPQNLYCIHIDIKSPLLLHSAMAAIANCFDNVFIASDTKKVKWGDTSVLYPDLSCMADLLNHHRTKWKYLINLTGQEFPLRTNYELVQIAKIFNGSNEIVGSKERMDPDRVKYFWTHRWSKTYQQTIFYNTMIERPPQPWNLTFYKGEIHGLFSPRFVEYIIEGDLGKQYLEWCIQSGHASEHYWNTLNYNRHLRAPGGYLGDDDLAHAYSFSPAIRAKHWQDENYTPRECQGQIIRGICVFGLGDLHWLASRRELFANKFYLTYEYLVYDCLEEQHRKRTKLRNQVSEFFDEEHYRNLPTVLYSRKDGLW